MKTVFEKILGGQNVRVQQSGQGGLFLTVNDREYSSSFPDVYGLSQVLWENHQINIRGPISGEILSAITASPLPEEINLSAASAESGDINKYGQFGA